MLLEAKAKAAKAPVNVAIGPLMDALEVFLSGISDFVACVLTNDDKRDPDVTLDSSRKGRLYHFSREPSVADSNLPFRNSCVDGKCRASLWIYEFAEYSVDRSHFSIQSVATRS